MTLLVIWNRRDNFIVVHRFTSPNCGGGEKETQIKKACTIA